MQLIKSVQDDRRGNWKYEAKMELCFLPLFVWLSNHTKSRWLEMCIHLLHFFLTIFRFHLERKGQEFSPLSELRFNSIRLLLACNSRAMIASNNNEQNSAQVVLSRIFTIALVLGVPTFQYIWLDWTVRYNFASGFQKC